MQKPNINKSKLKIEYEILGAKGVSSQINMRENIYLILSLIKFKNGMSSSKEVEEIRKVLEIEVKSRSFLKLYKDNFVLNKDAFWKVSETFHIGGVSKKEDDEAQILHLIEKLKTELSEIISELIN